jgi:hypothetical protein
MPHIGLNLPFIYVNFVQIEACVFGHADLVIGR